MLWVNLGVLLTLARVMTPPLPPDDPLFASKAVQLDSAHIWLLGHPDDSIQGTARHHDVSKSTLLGRLNGAISHKQEMVSRQHLSLAETRALAELAQACPAHAGSSFSPYSFRYPIGGTTNLVGKEP